MRISASVVAVSLMLGVTGATVMGCGGGDGAPANSPASTSDKASGGAGGGGGNGKAVQQGDKAPTFAVDSLNGTDKLKVAAGKVTIVDFWATWCEPCKKSFPKLQELYVKYKASGLEIVALSVDEDSDKGKIPEFAKTYGAKFPVGWGGKNVADQWKPENMPSTYIIGKDGTVKHIHRGYHDGEEADIEKELKALL